MVARILGTSFVALVLCAFGYDAVGSPQKDGKDAKQVKKDKENFEVPKDAIAGKVKSVDIKANTFTITLQNGKDRTFTVIKTTEFYGPKGGDRGTGPEGLKDDCMVKGYEIKVVPAKDVKTAKDVYLPQRKPEKDKGAE
ncbi:MAG: hypothetical protein L0215_05810 [Gemmataceae bacterium]|nr:hypothetical protein [Gemmataceae bacterium]